MTNNENLENLESIETLNQPSTQYVDEFGNPIDPSLIDEFGNYIGETTQYVDENGNPIDPSLIDENGNYIGNTEENVETITISAAEKQMEDKKLFTGMVTFDYNNVPITDIVNSIILDAINKGASDIHFDPFDDGIKIRIRIDGELNDYSIVPLYVKKNMITRIKIISGMNITESRIPQDGAIRTELADKTVDLRVSCLPTNLGEKIVIRIMDYSMTANGIEALDFNENNLNKVKEMLSKPNGIILVTGATGTGKSTTVYSMLQRLNVEGSNLVTVEDPIEMNIGGVNQVQAQPEIGLDFATVLRSILRQDPNVIMIGEIRDDETARIAVRASITGHLVLSTLHTNNSLSTIERLTDMSVERYLLGTALEGIVSQKLSRRLCEKCKKARPTTEYEKDVFKRALNKDVEEIYEPVGCPECSKGYRGRLAIHEVLLVNQVLRDAIIKGVPKEQLRKIVYGKLNTQTMLEDGLEKVVEGRTSFDEILKLIDLEDDLGNGTQLGFEAQMEEANLSEQAEFKGYSQLPPQPIYIPYPVNAQGMPVMPTIDMSKIPTPPVVMPTVEVAVKEEETKVKEEEKEELKEQEFDNIILEDIPEEEDVLEDIPEQEVPIEEEETKEETKENDKDEEIETDLVDIPEEDEILEDTPIIEDIEENESLDDILNELDISKEETHKEEDLQDIIEEESLDDTLNELDIKEEEKPDVLEDTPNDEELELEIDNEELTQEDEELQQTIELDLADILNAADKEDLKINDTEIASLFEEIDKQEEKKSKKKNSKKKKSKKSKKVEEVEEESLDDIINELDNLKEEKNEVDDLDEILKEFDEELTDKGKKKSKKSKKEKNSTPETEDELLNEAVLNSTKDMEDLDDILNSLLEDE